MAPDVYNRRRQARDVRGAPWTRSYCQPSPVAPSRAPSGPPHMFRKKQSIAVPEAPAVQMPPKAELE